MEDSSSRADEYTKRIHDMVEELNVKRNKDATLLTEFREKMQLQVSKSCDELEKHMNDVYVRNSNEMEQKIAKIFEAVERVNQLEREMQEIRNGVCSMIEDTSKIGKNNYPPSPEEKIN